MNTPLSKFLYIGFLLLGLYQAIFSKDYMQSAASLGIGLHLTHSMQNKNGMTDLLGKRQF